MRIASYNIQDGMGIIRWFDYFKPQTLQKMFSPSVDKTKTLHEIGIALKELKVDVALLQEVDGGSLRSEEQLPIISSAGEFDYSHYVSCHNFYGIANQGNGIVSQLELTGKQVHSLPGNGEKRKLLEARVRLEGTELVVLAVHLSLSEKSRTIQLDYITDIVRGYIYHNAPLVLGGDFNVASYEEMRNFLETSHLKDSFSEDKKTHPLWEPKKNLDYLLVSPEIEVEKAEVVAEPRLSDHLMVMADIHIK